MSVYFFSFLCCRTICKISATSSIWKEGVRGPMCSYSTKGQPNNLSSPTILCRGFFIVWQTAAEATHWYDQRLKAVNGASGEGSEDAGGGNSVPQEKGPALWFLSCSYSSSGPVRSALPGTSPLAPQSSRWGESDLQKSVISALALELFNFFPLDWLNIPARWPGSSHAWTHSHMLKV